MTEHPTPAEYRAICEKLGFCVDAVFHLPTCLTPVPDRTVQSEELLTLLRDMQEGTHRPLARQLPQLLLPTLPPDWNEWESELAGSLIADALAAGHAGFILLGSMTIDDLEGYAPNWYHTHTIAAYGNTFSEGFEALHAVADEWRSHELGLSE